MLFLIPWISCTGPEALKRHDKRCTCVLPVLLWALLVHEGALLATLGCNNVSWCAVVHTIASNTRLADHNLGTITAPHQYGDKSNKIFDSAISAIMLEAPSFYI